VIRALSCAVAAMLASVACSAGDDGALPNGGDSGAGTAGASGSAGSSGGGTGGGGTGGTGNPVETCGTSRVTPPLLRRLSRRELESSLASVFPAVAGQWQSTLASDSITTRGFDNDAATVVVSKQTARELDETAEGLAMAVAGALGELLPCAASAPDANCAGQFIDQYGRRLFRRPVTADERTRYLGFYQTASAQAGFAGGIGWVTRALVQSPSFVYRREIGAVDGSKRRLTAHEIATELAYTFTGTTPSDALLAEADGWAARGAPPTPAELTASATALLGAAGAPEHVAHFFESWVGYQRSAALTKANVPEFAALRAPMVDETRHFLEEVVFARRGGVRELLTASYTTPTAELAAFYGLPTPATAFGVVERPAGQGIGLLAQASVLSSLAQPNSSSPTKRGVLVFERFLCREKPALPGNVPLPPDLSEAPTTRERYERIHISGGTDCPGCHVQFDPIGFGFEHFDEVGRYRTAENGHPIDASSYVPDDSGDPLVSFTSQEELVRGLAELPTVGACVSGELTTWVFGGTWSCLGEQRRADFVSGTIGFVDYLSSLAAEPQFIERSTR
jgi:hypothetical protein